MKSGAADSMPSSVRRMLAKLGDDVNIARRKRRLSVRHMTEAAGISANTLRRIEKGDPSVSVGGLAMVLLALGLNGRLGQIVDMGGDVTGLMLDLDHLPKRISRRSTAPVAL